MMFLMRMNIVRVRTVMKFIVKRTITRMSDLEIISSSTYGAESRGWSRGNDNKLGGDPATNQFIDEHFEST